MDIKEKVKKLPLVCGVYMMKSGKGEVFYVGKASSLKKRVSSYFYPSNLAKNESLLENISDIDYIECASPEQALILEAALIKENKPKYNISLRDSKSYPYIEISKETYPRIFISRPKTKKEKILFGPYTGAKTLKSALVLIRRIFPYRSCRIMPKSACLFFSLKLCPAPCIEKISLSDYSNTIKNISKLLKGERKSLTRDLKNTMNKLAKGKKFEDAAKIRDKLIALGILYRGKPNSHELISLKELLDLKRIPLTIEAVDISRLGSQDATGSVVVFKEGVPAKDQYRRFLIKEAKLEDDYAMIEEVVNRRYSRLLKEKSKLPDLVIIDGGIGHVNRAYDTLSRLGVILPIIGIAKKKEEVWLPDIPGDKKNKKNPLSISRSSPGLQLIQRVRDEAHRFAHNYQLIRRRKKIIK